MASQDPAIQQGNQAATAVADNNPGATQAANAAYVQANPGVFGASTQNNTNPTVLTPNQAFNNQAIPVPVVTSPDISASIVAGANSFSNAMNNPAINPAPTTAENEQQGLLNQISSLTGQDVGKAQALLNTQATFGVPADQAALQQANAELATKTAQYNNLQANLGGNGNVETSAILAAQNAGLTKARAADIGLTSAKITAAQGNLTLALSQSQAAVDAQYSTIEDNIKTAQAQLAAIQPQLTRDEAAQADVRSAALKQQADDIAYARDQAKSVAALMVSNPYAGITQDDSLISASQKASQYLAQNPNVGGKPEVTGSYYDDFGNKIDVYSIMGADGVLRPINNSPTTSGDTSGSSTQGNMNFGISTGNLYGVPTYNTLDNNPGVARGVRNNNPGNIEATANSVKMPGVVGIEKGLPPSTQNPKGTPDMLIFAPGQGIKALSNMIATSPLYANMTAQQAVNMYITGNKNTSGSYTATTLGLDPNKDFQTQLKDPTVLQKTLDGITQGEGSLPKPGQTGTPTAQAPSFAEYGTLANTNFNPTDPVDSLTQKYLDTYIKSGAVPSASTLGRALKPQMMAKIAARANDLYTQATGNPLPSPAMIKTQQQIISNNNLLANNLKIQEQTVAANVDLSLNNMKNADLNASGFKPLDNFINTVQDLFNNPTTGQLIAQNTTIQNELGSLLAVKNASGTTVFDKMASAGIISTSDTQAMVTQKVNALLQEAANFADSLNNANAGAYKITDPFMQDPSNPLRGQYQQALAAGVSPADIMAYIKNLK